MPSNTGGFPKPWMPGKKPAPGKPEDLKGVLSGSYSHHLLSVKRGYQILLIESALGGGVRQQIVIRFLL